MNNKPRPENHRSLNMSYNGISNSLCELEDDAKELGDEKLMKLIEECYAVYIKIGQYLDETYDWEQNKMNRFKKMWYSIVARELIRDYLGFIQASKMYEESLTEEIDELEQEIEKLRQQVWEYKRHPERIGKWDMVCR